MYIIHIDGANRMEYGNMEKSTRPHNGNRKRKFHGKQGDTGKNTGGSERTK